MADRISIAKRKRESLDLDTKLKMIKLSDEGVAQVDIAKMLNKAKQTVNTVLRNKVKILQEIESATPGHNIHTKRIRNREKMIDVVIGEMEKLLTIWFEHQTKRSLPMSRAILQEKALSMFNYIKAQKGEEAKDLEFGASRGWFDRFKKRSNIFNIEVQGEAAVADTETAAPYKDTASLYEFFRHEILPRSHPVRITREPNHAKSTEHSPSETYFKPLNEDDRGAHSSEKLPKEEEGVFIKQDLFGSGVFIAEEILNEESINIVKEEQIDVDVAHGFSSSNDDSQCFSEKVESVNENDRTIFMETQESPTNTKNTKKSNVKTKSNVSTRNLPDVSNSSVDVSVKGKNQSGETDYGSLINSMIEEMDLTQQVLAKFYILKIIDMGKKQYLSPSGVVL